MENCHYTKVQNMKPEEDAAKGVVKIRSWAEFKRLAESLKPKAIVYNIEQNGLSPERELTSLRLILPAGPAYYVLIDSPRGEEKLKETGIPLRRDAKGNLYLEEEDVVKFLKEQFKREDLIICSYWTI
jgi:DNA transposition AAA+ family ATPase